MKKVTRLILALAMLNVLTVIGTQAQFVANPPAINLAAPAANGPAGLVTSSGLNITVAPGQVYCNGDTGVISSTQFTLQANTTYQVVFNCSTNSLIARVSPPATQPIEIQLATAVAGASTVALTDNRGVLTQVNAGDAAYMVPLGSNCNLNVTTGALAAATAGTTNPGMLRVAANNAVLYANTTAATNVVALDCDITPPQKLTSGKGVIINNVQLFYGVQTTALTSITAPTLSTNTYPATGAAAAVTTAAAGGVLTVTPTLQLTTTTSGQCFSENIALGTPVNVTTDLQRVTLEQLFNQTAAAATQLQICGVLVHYTSVPI